MAIRINTNIFSALVQHNLTRNTRDLEQASARLASGLRINNAGDDPAGMASSEQLRYEVRSVRQNQQNVSGAFSLVATAESHSNEVINLLQRGRELAVQAGNETLNANDRQILQQELSEIMQEIDRTANSAKYGDNFLFRGTFQGLKIQVGPTQAEQLSLSLADYRTTSLGTRAQITSANPVGGGALVAGQVKINGVDVPASATDGVSLFNPAASATAKAAAINQIEGQTAVRATAIPAEQVGIAAVAAVNLDATVNTLTINGIMVPPTAVQNGDANRSLATAINQLTGSTGVAASIDAGGRLTLKGIDGRNVRIETGGNVAQRLGMSAAPGAQTFDLSGKIELSANKPFSVDDPVGLIGLGSAQQVSGDPTSALANASLTSSAGVAKALKSLDAALDQLSAERSRLGVFSNRLETLNESLARRADDLTANDSRIRDADFALETARLTQSQILQEASIAMLVQANSSPRKALELLQ